MKLQERWPLYVKWIIVWLVILPMILNWVGCYGTSFASWLCALSVGVVFGLCVPLIDEMFLFFCQTDKR
ncbi:hypothetical protein BJH39_004107 [Salmonella enterica]|nr:hypothetical protein [Salmonella enterica]